MIVLTFGPRQYEGKREHNPVSCFILARLPQFELHIELSAPLWQFVNECKSNKNLRHFAFFVWWKVKKIIYLHYKI